MGPLSRDHPGTVRLVKVLWSALGTTPPVPSGFWLIHQAALGHRPDPRVRRPTETAPESCPSQRPITSVRVDSRRLDGSTNPLCHNETATATPVCPHHGEGLITRRSQVQILPPQPDRRAPVTPSRRGPSRVGAHVRAQSSTRWLRGLAAPAARRGRGSLRPTAGRPGSTRGTLRPARSQFPGSRWSEDTLALNERAPRPVAVLARSILAAFVSEEPWRRSEARASPGRRYRAPGRQLTRIKRSATRVTVDDLGPQPFRETPAPRGPP